MTMVRETSPEARTIAITGGGSETEGLVQKVVAEGADAVCYKPFDVSQLLGTIERLSRQKR
jgi:two-component system, NtrC family, response regulator HydG